MKDLELDPSGATLSDAASGIYDAILEGKFTKEDLIKFINITAENFYEPLPVRIFAKTIGVLLNHKEGKGVIVVVEDKQWLVCIEGDQVKIKGPCTYDCPDESLVTIHETKEDAVTAAALLQEGYTEEQPEDPTATIF